MRSRVPLAELAARPPARRPAGFWGGGAQFKSAAIFHWQGPKPRTCLPCLLDFAGHADWEARCRAADEAAEGAGRARSLAYACTDAGLGMLRAAQREDGGALYRRMAGMYGSLLQQAGELAEPEEGGGAAARERQARRAADAEAEARAGLSEEQLELLQ